MSRSFGSVVVGVITAERAAATGAYNTDDIITAGKLAENLGRWKGAKMERNGGSKLCIVSSHAKAATAVFYSRKIAFLRYSEAFQTRLEDIARPPES